VQHEPLIVGSWAEAFPRVLSVSLGRWRELRIPRGERARVWVRAYPEEGEPVELSVLVDPAGPGQGTVALDAALQRLLPRLGDPFDGDLVVRVEGASTVGQTLWAAAVRVGRIRPTRGAQSRREQMLREVIRESKEINKQLVVMHGQSSDVIHATASLVRELRLAAPLVEESPEEGDEPNEWVEEMLGEVGQVAVGILRGWSQSSTSGEPASASWATPRGSVPSGAAWRAPRVPGAPSPPPLAPWLLESELDEVSEEAPGATGSEELSGGAAGPRSAPAASATTSLDAPLPESPGNVASVPFMLTAAARLRLKKLGLDDAEVDRLNPIDAWEILGEE